MQILPQPPHPDRRVQRTRRQLQHALLELILERRYDKITVQDILDRANVGRSTFYAHFRDKDDLLTGGLPHVVAHLHEQIAVTDDAPFLSYRDLLVHMGENHPLYEAMLGGTGIDVILREVTASLRHSVGQRVEALFPPSATATERAVVTTYLTGAVMASITWWLDEGMPCPPQEMDALLQKLMIEGIGGFVV